MCKPSIRIDWMKGYSNDPSIILDGIQVPEYPSASDPIWEKRDNLHRAQKGHFVFYFYTDGKPTKGFGGRIFEGTFMDGISFCYRGAWSSRASCVNQAWPMNNIVDVVCGSRSTAVTINFLMQLWNATMPKEIDICPIRLNRNDGYVYMPMHKGYCKRDPGFTYPE